MINLLSLLSALVILFHAPVFAQRADSLDLRLAGTWQGARIEVAACDTYIWRVYRGPDGKYVVEFFTDRDMTDRLSREEGSWWTNEGIFYERPTEQENIRNAYRYTVKAGKEMNFEYISRENEKNASDCEAEYSFTEFKYEQ